MSKVRKQDLLRVSLRLAVLQSTWCEGSMQSVGLAYCLLPGLRRLSSTPEDVDRAMQPHQEPFNTHPFLAGAVAGATLRLIEEGKSPKEMSTFLRSTMGPLAAVGDPFFRAALPSFVAVVASLVAMLGGVLAGIITLLVLFNSIHVFVRLSGVFLGYREKYNVLQRVARWLSPTRTKILTTASAVGIGVVLDAAARIYGPAEPRWVGIVLAVGGVLVALGLTKWKSFGAYAMPVALVICLFIGVLV